ncbi:MAG: DNA-binding response regulator [Planctomycetota bacterium]|nr:MAG: DNA-binding response regulator [Planctomycetota bacterium]
MKILVVEDEAAIAAGLRFNFEQEGYEVVIAVTGEEGLHAFAAADPPFDLVILDLMLPQMSGYEVCRRIRKQDSQVPIIVLSARTLAEDKAVAFDCGADQYVTKPFALLELLSRVRNLVQRRRRGRGAPKVYRFGNVVVDPERFTVTVGEQTTRLTTLEMQLLNYFLENRGKVLSRQQILEDVWKEPADITTRSIDNFVLRLRRLIEPDPGEPRYIVSIRGTGYQFMADVTEQTARSTERLSSDTADSTS